MLTDQRFPRPWLMLLDVRCIYGPPPQFFGNFSRLRDSVAELGDWRFIPLRPADSEFDGCARFFAVSPPLSEPPLVIDPNSPVLAEAVFRGAANVADLVWSPYCRSWPVPLGRELACPADRLLGLLDALRDCQLPPEPELFQALLNQLP